MALTTIETIIVNRAKYHHSDLLDLPLKTEYLSINADFTA
jgi:hypothetical protein